MIKTLYVICGLPTSGKSMLGEYIKENYDIPLYKSVAASLNEKSPLPWIRTEEFDQLIYENQEKADSKMLLSGSERVAVIGWHIHNHVYSIMRGGNLKDEMYKSISNMISKTRVCILYMSSTPDEMIERMIELPPSQIDKVSAWYHEWLHELNRLISALNVESYTLSAEHPGLLYERCKFLQHQLGLKESNVTT